MAYSDLSSLAGRSGGLNYDPNQPRVPAGHPRGAQWTAMNVFAGGRVQIPDVDTSELRFGSGPPSPTRLRELSHLAFDDTNGRYPLLLVRPRARTLRPLANELSTYEKLAAEDGPDRKTIIDFRAFGYIRDSTDEPFNYARVHQLTFEQASEWCDRLPDVQQMLNEEDKRIRREQPNITPQKHGSLTHHAVAMRVKALGDRNLAAEVGYFNGEEEPKPRAFQGKRGSFRVDGRQFGKSEKEISRALSPSDDVKAVGPDEEAGVIQRLNPETACYFKLKTGNAVVRPTRIDLVARNAAKAFPGLKRIILMQVKPER